MAKQVAFAMLCLNKKQICSASFHYFSSKIIMTTCCLTVPPSALIDRGIVCGTDMFRETLIYTVIH